MVKKIRMPLALAGVILVRRAPRYFGINKWLAFKFRDLIISLFSLNVQRMEDHATKTVFLILNIMTKISKSPYLNENLIKSTF